MPAQLDAPGASTQPCAGDQRAGLCFGLSFPPPFFISPVLFVSLTLWVGIAATCWLSDSRADCPLTVPSPEQKSRRGRPSVCPYLLLPPCLWKALALLKPLPLPVERQELKLSSRTALPLGGQQRGSGTPCWQRLAWPAVATLLPTGLAPLWSFRKVPPKPPVFWWKHRKREGARSGKVRPPAQGQWSSLPSSWPVLGCL